MFKRKPFSTEPRAFIAREIKEGFKCYKILQSWQIGLAADEENDSFAWQISTLFITLDLSPSQNIFLGVCFIYTPSNPRHFNH